MIPLFPKLDKNKKTIEGIPVKDLLSQYGSPIFVISERIIAEKYRLFSEALTKYYPNSQIAYSVKTNYLPGIVDIMKNLGAWAEVVSGFEYWLAKKLGFPGSQIIFNGPDKKPEEIGLAIKDGAILNADNGAELSIINDVATRLNVRTKIGIRLNAVIGRYPWSRFGFNIENGEARRICALIKNEYKHIEPAGLHIHIGTNINEVEQYQKSAEIVSRFAKNIIADFGFNIRYLDLGGGFASAGSRLRNSPIWVVPEMDHYIKVIITEVARYLPSAIKLYLEPGRFLVDEAGILITKVINVRNVSDFQVVSVDSSTSFFASATWRHHLVDLITNRESIKDLAEITTHISGNSCMGMDFLVWGASLPPVVVNDTLILYNTGAYNIVKSEQFIRPRPAVVMIKENSNVKCIRRKESYENMIALDNF